MALTIQSLNTLKDYIDGVMARADHHANGVNEIVLALIGGVVWRSTDEVVVKQYNGASANILWMKVNDKTYCFTYNHSIDSVEVKDRTMNGKVIYTFNNLTPISEIKQFFASL